MVSTSPTSSSSSSAASLNSFNGVTTKATTIVKFICSYGGRIIPRNSKLHYTGGETRVLAVERCLSFTELQVKLRELCGWGLVSLRCQLPADDTDTLVSVTSDEDLANLYEVYELASQDPIPAIKIRSYLFLQRVGEIRVNGQPSIPPPDLVVAHRRFFRRHQRSFIDGPAGYRVRPTAATVHPMEAGVDRSTVYITNGNNGVSFT